MTEKLTGDRVVRREAFSLTFKAEPGHFILESGGQRLTLACQGAVSPECRVDFGAKWQRIGEREEDGSVIWTFEAPSSVWLRRALHVKITAEEVLFQLEVTGEGAIDRVTYFSGFDDALATEPLATFSHLSWARRDYTRSWSGSPLELQRIFNPQPNLYEEQELPPGCPQRITAATTFGPEMFNTFFAPAPYVYVFDGRFSAGVVAGFGENRYTHYDYLVGNGWGLQLHYDGMTHVNGVWKAPAIRVGFGANGGNWEGALVGYLDYLRAGPFLPPAPTTPSPDWARRPMVCGWGQQTAWARQKATSVLPEGSPITTGAGGYATQSAYGEITRLLDRHSLPYGTLTIDMGWSSCLTIPVVDTTKWPDLKAYIAQEHARGKKVMLWLATWNPGGAPPEYLMAHADGLKDCVDPTHPGFRAELEKTIAYCISPDGLDADGFKLDFTGDIPRGPGYRPHAPLWGVELLFDYVSLIHRAMKPAKRDSVLETHCAHPLFVHVTDMLRLNDIFSVQSDVSAMMVFRARIAQLVNPAWPIDTDNDPFISRAAWLNYMRLQPKLGVPSLYTLTHVSFAANGSDLEAISDADLAEVSRVWLDYLASGCFSSAEGGCFDKVAG